jgi:SAM-dependent methyltransferase
MTVFGDYAGYYDLLYQDKDYKNEVDYVHALIEKYGPKTRSILELGCGTGKHALLLAETGLSVHGVDISQDMLQQATQLQQSADDEVGRRVTLAQGDVQTYRCGQKFDVVLSMFHVMSYQISNEALHAAFSTASAHLQPGGIFIFDCWYGPAVLSERPVVRVKRLENDAIQVTRIAEPVLHASENRVDVNYHVFVKDKQTGSVSELREKHGMRYLFTLEVKELLKTANMEYLRSEEWMSGNEPDERTWGVCFIARK